MNELPSDLIFSIFLSCEKVKDIVNLMLLNKHWFSVSQYEALWRVRFSYFIDDSIRSEEEKLNITNKQRQSLMKPSTKPKPKGMIKKLLNLKKSHVEQVEKLYNRKGCTTNMLDNSAASAADFIVGTRFYTIYKQEFLTFVAHKTADTATRLLKQVVNPIPLKVNDCDPWTRIMPMIEKWNAFVEFAEFELLKHSNETCTATTTTTMEQQTGNNRKRQHQYDIHNDCPKIIAAFEKDYCKMRMVFNNVIIRTESEESMKEFWEINSKIVEPIRILTDGKRFKYPLDGYLFLEIAVATMNFDLVKGILDCLIVEGNNNGKSTRSRGNQDDTTILQYGSHILGLLMERSYAVEEIMYYLKCFNSIFPSIIDQFKQNSSKDLVFKCDEDLLAYHFIASFQVPYRMLFSLELFEKAITDWNYTREGINFLDEIYNHYSDITKSIDFYFSFRKEKITVQHLIHLIELYEKQKGKVMINNEIVRLFAIQGKLELVKYFCDVRGFKLFRNKRMPLVYSYLNSCFQSGDDTAEMLGYFATKLEGDFFSSEAGRTIGTNPLNRMINIFNHGVGDSELWFAVFEKLLKRMPSILEVKQAIIWMNDVGSFQYSEDVLQIFNRYLKSLEDTTNMD